MGTVLFLVGFTCPQINIQSVIAHQRFAVLAMGRGLFGEMMKMNRELIFRGFQPCDGPDTIVEDGEKVKGRWVYGYYYKGIDGDVILSQPRDYGYADADKVIPSTVGQYVGLTDKFVLRKIFEYDIIDSSSGENVGNYYENKEILKRKSNFVVERMGTKKWRCSEQKAIKCGCGYAE